MISLYIVHLKRDEPIKSKKPLKRPNIGASHRDMCNTTIANSSELKYLGVTFDEKLTFLKHIELAKAKNLKNINVLKILSNPKNGLSSNQLIKVSNTLIRSSLEFGCQTYSTASKTNISKLNTIYNKTIRLSIGALRTSPIKSIHVEAGTNLFTERVFELTAKYITKVKGNCTHQNHNSINEIKPNRIRLKTGIQRAIERQEIDNFPLNKIQQFPKISFRHPLFPVRYQLRISNIQNVIVA